MSGGLQSMTGFGSASAESDRYRVTVDARSVNHRSLDLVVRLREPYRSVETALRDLVREKLQRGRVELFLEVTFVGREVTEVTVDHDLAARVLEALDAMRGETGLAPASVGDVLRVPGVVKVAGGEREWTDADDALILGAVSAALDQLAAARDLEGAKLTVEFRAGLERLRRAHGELTARRGDVVEHYKNGLEERLQALLAAPLADSSRLEQEVALLVEKSDVSEELDRLAAHLEHVGQALEDGSSPVGKRIDFLLQEMQRELNTIGAKCRDLEMSSSVVEARLVCEQMREQVQNVE